MTRAPNYVTDTLSSSSSTLITASKYALSPSDSVPADLSSISVLRKTSPDITDYIIPRVHIEQIIYINAIFYSNEFKELARMDIIWV